MIEVNQPKSGCVFKVAQLRMPSVTTRRPQKKCRHIPKNQKKSRQDSLRRKGSPAFFLPQFGLRSVVFAGSRGSSPVKIVPFITHA